MRNLASTHPNMLTSLLNPLYDPSLLSALMSAPLTPSARLPSALQWPWCCSIHTRKGKQRSRLLFRRGIFQRTGFQTNPHSHLGIQSWGLKDTRVRVYPMKASEASVSPILYMRLSLYSVSLPPKTWSSAEAGAAPEVLGRAAFRPKRNSHLTDGSQSRLKVGKRKPFPRRLEEKHILLRVAPTFGSPANPDMYFHVLVKTSSATCSVRPLMAPGEIGDILVEAVWRDRENNPC